MVRNPNIIETDKDISMAKLTTSVVRECSLNRLVTSGPGLSEDTMPSQNEVETISDMAYEAITKGQFIDFGYWPNDFIKKASKRGGDLYAGKALGHPFSTPWMFMHTWTDKDIQDDEMMYSAYLVNPFLNENKNTLGVDVEIVALEGFRVSHRLTVLGIGDRAILMPDAPRPKGTKYACSVIPLAWRFPQEVRDLYYKEHLPGHFISPEHAAASNVLDPFCVAMLLVNTRGLPSEIIKPAIKLNRARVKNGKLPIPPYRKIDSDLYVTSMLHARSADRIDHGGTHASPVPHVRIGHWRQYKTGERTFINDTLVRVTEEMRAQFKATRSNYTAKLPEGTME